MTPFLPQSQRILANELAFKSKLAIGEDAFATLKLKHKIMSAWDTAGAAASVGGLAASKTVATTFFGSFWTTAGITTATTPVGWIIGASLIGGAAWIGFSRFIQTDTDKIIVIPKYINTPLDVLATSLFDMLSLYSLHIAHRDGQITQNQEQIIKDNFIEHWGYDKAFVDENLIFISQQLSQTEFQEVVTSLAIFLDKNPDCNYREMTRDLIHLAEQLSEDNLAMPHHNLQLMRLVKRTFKQQTDVKSKVFNRLKQTLRRLKNKP